ncbi:MAG TPA: LPS export ABC transporter periplasmic protein LptC [Candidatus Sulfotelmatobacter sp.]|nr:LPS export ABC transporter periplasmic protein LptC [Candidatus Sulfotelmatobacter sp.]
MPLKIYRLRRVLAGTAILLTMLVAGMYFYARSRATNILKTIPGKMGFDIKQTAHGFQISKSDAGRTLFTVQATDVKQFKLNGDAELHNVSIVLYGRDSSRYDQIYGDDFSYNTKTGEVTAKGEVQIDLLANPEGGTRPDQSTPKEVKNPIHLKTSDLVFNKDTGNASTDARVDFKTSQATGWAVGVRYAGKTNVLTLLSQVHLTVNGKDARNDVAAADATPSDVTKIEAEYGVITRDPHQIELDHPRLIRPDENMAAEHATLYLSAENHVDRVLATGNVTTEARTGKTKGSADSTTTDSASSVIHGRSDQAEFLLAKNEDVLRTGILTGKVHFEQSGAQPMQGDAGRVILDFAGQNELQKVHAVDGARLRETGSNANPPKPGNIPARSGTNSPQDFEITAPVIDFAVADGRVLQHATTSGAAQITITPAQPPNRVSTVPVAQKTTVTAGKFDAEFATSEGHTRLAMVHGAPDAKIVNSNPGQPDRVSTSEMIVATFFSQGGIEAITQTGNVFYTDNQPPEKRMQAWADSGRYTPADQNLLLTGSPRVTNGGMATTANTIRMNRATDDALAEGDVKSTYNDLKERPDGALLASSSPIHVTSRAMAAHNSPAVALYTGDARLWQDANVIEAPSIQFDRDKRFVTAQGTSAQPVQTVLVQSPKPETKPAADSAKGPTANASAGRSSAKDPKHSNQSSPIAITALKLTYADSQRKAHYEGGVTAKGVDFTATSKIADAYFLPRSQTSTQGSSQASAQNSTPSPTAQTSASQLDHIVALGDVVVTEPGRRAEGQKLVYTTADDKFVLTGGSPSIFDAEQGKITGVSLTFFRRDDRVLVEGEASKPVVTQTRVAR